MGKHSEPEPDDRLYGHWYAESVGEDLYRIAGRILSDLKVDQVEDRMPRNAILVVAVKPGEITVQVHLTPEPDAKVWGYESIRSRVQQIGSRYNWQGRRNRADVRYRFSVSIRTVRSRLDATALGSILG